MAFVSIMDVHVSCISKQSLSVSSFFFVTSTFLSVGGFLFFWRRTRPVKLTRNCTFPRINPPIQGLPQILQLKMQRTHFHALCYHEILAFVPTDCMNPLLPSEIQLSKVKKMRLYLLIIKYILSHCSWGCNNKKAW